MVIVCRFEHEGLTISPQVSDLPSSRAATFARSLAVGSLRGRGSAGSACTARTPSSFFVPSEWSGCSGACCCQKAAQIAVPVGASAWQSRVTAVEGCEGDWAWGGDRDHWAAGEERGMAAYIGPMGHHHQILPSRPPSTTCSSGLFPASYFCGCLSYTEFTNLNSRYTRSIGRHWDYQTRTVI